MNPIRLRLMQYLMIHGTGTVSQIKEELCDIPPASLYRHIKTLCEGGCLEIVEEKQVRGTVERTYALKQKGCVEEDYNSAEHIIQSKLMSLMLSFTEYFAEESADPVRDMLSLTTSTLLLSDEEFVEMTAKILEAISPHLCNKPTEDRKQRRFTLLSSPCEKE